MGIPLDDLIKNPERLQELRPPQQTPNSNALFKKVHGEWQPTDKYYDNLSELVEQYPIVTARVRKG